MPFRNLNNESQAIILLPGFEKDSTQLSQQLLDHILYLSTSSILVFRKDTYARESDTEMINKIKNIFADVEPIFALSRGDIEQDQNENIKLKVMEDFDIPCNRVVITGDPEKYKNPWREELIESINLYGHITGEIEEKRGEVLQIIADEILDSMDSMKELLNDYEEGLLSVTTLKDMKDRKLLNDFRATYESYLTDVRKSIISTLNTRKESAKRNFEDYVDENIGLWQNVKSFVVSSQFRETINYERKIEELWENAAELSPTEQVYDVLANEMDELEGKIQISHKRISQQEKSKGNLQVNDYKLPVKLNEEENAISEPVQLSLDRINQFFLAESDQDIVTLEKRDLQALVYVGSMLGRQTFLGSQLIESAASVEGDLENVRKENKERLEKALEKSGKELESMQEKINLTSQKTRMILTGIPVILGVDVALDGQSDILAAATAALAQVGIAISPAALLSIIGGGLVAIKAVDLIHKQALQNNERKIQMAHAGRNIINELPELQADAFCNVLRNIFEKIEARIGEQHEWKSNELGYDQTLMRLQYQTNSIIKTNQELIREVMKRETVAFKA